MGFLDDMKKKADELGGKAGEALATVKDKVGDLMDTAKRQVDANKDGKIDFDEWQVMGVYMRFTGRQLCCRC